MRSSWKTYSQPLRVIILALGEEGTKGVVAGDDEASKVGQELATEVEDDEEEVKGDDPNDGIGLGNTGLFLKVVERGVFGQLELRVSQASRWCQRCRAVDSPPCREC